MKQKLLFTVCVFMIALGISASAEQIGEVIGEVIPADINTYINNQPIPSYNTGGETAVRIADLANYGFDVEFVNGISCANYQPDKEVKRINVVKKPNLSVLYSDIEVQINGVPVPSYNIGGNMAVPIERVCEVYLETNKENEYSEYSLNYTWDEKDRKLCLDVSNDRVSYQDFMIDLIKAAHMDFDSPFYNDFVKDENVENPNEPYLEKFTDIHGTKLEEYIHLLEIADLVDTYAYEGGEKLHPYRGVTRTDAAFLLTRILGSPVDAERYIKNEISRKNNGENVELEWNYPKTYYLDGITNYLEQNKDFDDWYKVPEWIRPYFCYILEIGVMDINNNNLISHNEFLNKTVAEQLIKSTIEYMEQGVINSDIRIRYKENDYDLKSPTQKIDNILYVPVTSITSKVYFGDNTNITCKKLDEEMSSYYYINFGSTNEYIFTNYSLGAHRHFSRNIYRDIYMTTLYKYPIRLLYGEPMIALDDKDAFFDYTFYAADNILEIS